MINHFGHPINLSEYCTCIANYSSVHMICIRDGQYTSSFKRRHDEIKKDFNELVLADRSGRKRFTFFKHCWLGSIYESLKKMKETEGNDLLLFPYIFSLNNDLGEKIVEWKDKNDRSISVSNVVFDFRNEEQKRREVRNNEMTTFKQQFDVWNSKPQLLLSENIVDVD